MPLAPAKLPEWPRYTLLDREDVPPSMFCDSAGAILWAAWATIVLGQPILTAVPVHADDRNDFRALGQTLELTRKLLFDEATETSAAMLKVAHAATKLRRE